MGIKHVYEIEGVVSSRDSFLYFLNRCSPLIPKADVLLKPREQRLIKINVPFIDEMSKLAMIKLLDLTTGCNNTIKLRCIGNTGYLDLTNNSSDTFISVRIKQ